MNSDIMSHLCRDDPDVPVVINEWAVKSVKQDKYLGTVFDDKLTFEN